MRRRRWIDLSVTSRKRPAVDGEQTGLNITTKDTETKTSDLESTNNSYNKRTRQDIRQQLDNLEYGNYPAYYKYRNLDKQGDKDGDIRDHRLDHFKKEWFEGKDVLDIGCNRGEITYYVAKLFKPKTIVGLDIDEKLINLARKGLHSHIQDLMNFSNGLRRDRMMKQQHQQEQLHDLYHEDPIHFPLSIYLKNGPLVVPKSNLNELSARGITNAASSSNNEHIDINQGEGQKHFTNNEPTLDRIDEMASQSDVYQRFPNNITFMVHDYVLNDDDLVKQQEGNYDVILCLSVTKWIHLNYKDDGLKRFFKRIYNHLRPNGGILILEAQPFKNYVRRKRLSQRIKENYQSLIFKPEQFKSYLLSEEVGFTSCEYTGLTSHAHLGFQRPIQVFKKE